MFGQTTIDNFNNAIANLSSQIQELELQLKQLREDRKVLETEQQAKLTLIGAGQSALDQIQNFLSLATVGDNQDLLTDFWAQLEVLKDTLTVYPQLEETAPDESDLDNVENSDTIEVDASLISQMIRDEVNGNGNGNGHKSNHVDIGTMIKEVEDISEADTELTEEDKIAYAKEFYSGFTLKELKALCQEQGLPDTGTKAALVKRLVSDQMSQIDT